MTGGTDKLRANGRIGATAYLELSELAQKKGTTVESNSPGGLFGHVNAHLCCGVENTIYYEYFPDAAGKEMGLINPPVTTDGVIKPSEFPGSGYEWDWAYFEKKRGL